MDKKFVHLQLHTEYSLSDGLLTMPSLMAKAAALQLPALAITDNSNLYAAVKFYQAALQAGIKPIIGADIHVMRDAGAKESDKITLLCMNNTGYQHLLQLLSKSYLEGQASGHPCILQSWLDALNDGLIALSGGLAGDIAKAILANDMASASERLCAWQKLFPQRFYLELSRIGDPREATYLTAALKLAETHAVPVVATNQVRFLTRDQFEAHEARVCIQQGVTLNDPDRPRAYTDQQYLRSYDEMAKLFAHIPEALTNSVEIAKRCNVDFKLGHARLPHFPVPADFTSEDFLAKVAHDGLEERLQTLYGTEPAVLTEKRPAYLERLARELAVINKMGFAGYFLIVADFSKWAKDNGIPVGPGRGSGPGSLVAYTLKITDLDPLALDLLFERFLNPERVSMPDFDIDFCMEGRDRVIEYVMEKHGHECVSQIITYGTMAAKAVVRDVGRVLALSYGYVDKIAKLIPFELGMTLEKALAQEPLLRERYEQEEDVRTLIDLARQLEGITRNVGKHAGGIVIAPGKLTDFVPLYCEPGEAAHPVTQFDKDDVEAVGLVKFDFLGLKTLTIIDRALRVINVERQKASQAPVDIGLIPLNDTQTFELLKTCKSTAVFQLESHGMRDIIKRLQPDCFEDLIALVALFRPGPLQSGMVDDFINRKQGRAKVSYPHPDLEPILRPTYGVIVYQEQVMQIAQVLAGYTLGAADILRRAMGKKKPEEMAKQRAIFCDGAKARGVAAETATHIFDLMEKFAGYGFNKSHSASYALIAYQTAWLKTHYPAAFMAAVLSSDMDRTEKIIVLLDECKAFHLSVTPPDINESLYFFKVLDDQHILYGLGAIKGVGEAAIENIINARAQGAFNDLFDFCQRVDLRKINKRVIEALIKAGCFDQLGQHRATLFASLQNALLQAEQAHHNQRHGQVDLLSMHVANEAPPFVVVAPWTDEVQLLGEKETLGFYLSGHPLNRFANELKQFTTCRISELQPGQHQHVRVAGIVMNVRTRQTKRGDRMAIFALDDGEAQIEVVCFAETFHKYRPLLSEDQMLVAEGDVNLDEFSNSARLLCKELYTLTDARERYAKCLRISLREQQPWQEKDLQPVLQRYSGGHCAVVIRMCQGAIQADITLGQRWHVTPADPLMAALEQVLPVASVEIIYS